MKLLQSLIAGAFVATISTSFAAAEGLHVTVGDLSQRDVAVAFDHRLAETANRFCFARYRPIELSALSACQKAVREEAMDQLTQGQRLAFAQALRGPQALANAAR